MISPGQLCNTLELTSSFVELFREATEGLVAPIAQLDGLDSVVRAGREDALGVGTCDVGDSRRRHRNGDANFISDLSRFGESHLGSLRQNMTSGSKRDVEAVESSPVHAGADLLNRQVGEVVGK